MSPNDETISITQENLDQYLNALAKEYRKLNKKGPPAEIILIGGAAILAEYGFRSMTYDVDAVIFAATAIKDAINVVADRYGLPRGWLNADFKRTASYSDKLVEFSVYYKQFANTLTVRTVTAEYLIAMKLMSGRQYKNDLSDIIGILWEHSKNGRLISREAIDAAVVSLYGKDAVIPDMSARLLEAIFEIGDYEALYCQVRDSELESRELLVEFEQKYPGVLKSENINDIIHSGRRGQKSSMLARLEEKKNLVNEMTADSRIES
jgi:hypothetical protein